MKCEQCDAELRAGDRFCLRCGQPVPVATQPINQGADEPVTPPGAPTREGDIGADPSGLSEAIPAVQPSVTATEDAPVTTTEISVDETATAEIAPTASQGSVPAVSAAVAGAPVPRIGPTVEQLLAANWPSALQLASVILLVETLVHAVPALVAALAGLVRDGVAPEPLGDLFRLPFQGLLAANGGVGGVGLWVTGVAIIVIATSVAWRGRGWTGSPTDLTGQVLFGLKTALAHGVVLVVLSFLIEARGFDVSSSIDLPGDLVELSSIDRWSRLQLFVLSTLVVTVALLGLQLATLMPRRAWLAAAVRAAWRAFLAMTFSAGLLVLVAAALQLPSEPDVRRWIAQGLEFVATGALALLDIGAHRLGSAIEVLFGERAVEPVRGPWVAVLIIVALGVSVAVVHRSYGDWRGPLGFGAGLAAAAAPGLGLLAADAVTGLGGELFRSAVLVAIVVPVVVVAVTPAAAIHVREFVRQRPATRPAPIGGVSGTNDRQCHGCGSAMNATARFCGKCGSPAG